MEPFFGVALHGFPNYFFITGPDVGAQARYVVECLGLMKRPPAPASRCGAAASRCSTSAPSCTAQPFRVSSAFDLSSAATPGNETYDGEATLT